MSCQHLTEANLTMNLLNTMVYKDECMRCYETNKSDGGIDVCLKCFHGGCTAKDFQHSTLHFSMKSHPIALNLKMVWIGDKKGEE